MSDDHLPKAVVDPNLLKYLGGLHEVDYTRRYPVYQKPSRIDMIDDRDLAFTMRTTYKYGSKLVLNDDGVYMLNRLYTYFRDNCGVTHVNDWHHIQTLINTHPMLKELWDQFEAALVLCGSIELANRGRLG